MTIDISFSGGESESIAFGALTYADNQVIKPKMIAAFKTYAEANKIPITDA